MIVVGPQINTDREAGFVADLDKEWRIYGHRNGGPWVYCGAIGVRSDETSLFWRWIKEGRLSACQGPASGGGWNAYARINPLYRGR